MTSLSFDPLDPPKSLVLIFFCLASIYYKWFYGKRTTNPTGLPFPPGPKPKIFLGNLFDIPSSHSWLTYTRWGKQYGDLLHLNILGQHTVIINSSEIARDLLEKRSNVYSDRFPSPMLDFLGWEWSLATMRYSDRWREHRRLFHQSFRLKAALNYRPTQMRKVHELLRNLLSTPQDFMAHGRTLAGAIIMSTMYGHEVTPDDYFVSIAEQAGARVNGAAFTSANLVNVFPILRHIPSWLPGAGFKREALESQRLTGLMQTAPFEFVKENMKRGIGAPSVLAELLDDNAASGRGEDGENVIKRVTAVAYAAGADTSASASATFFLAMRAYPEAQKKAQNEIDAVIGPHRLPTWEDRPSLPYIEALYREVMRWHPATPLGVPHASLQDDIYNNTFIPKGTAVVANVWAMTHNEDLYPDPYSFKPERFFTSDGKLNDDDAILAFGFGRRICPGRHMADATVWLEIVSVLATFDIAKAKDDPVDVKAHALYTDSLVSHPHPFQCSITPRSNVARNLILETMTTSTA